MIGGLSQVAPQIVPGADLDRLQKSCVPVFVHRIQDVRTGFLEDLDELHTQALGQIFDVRRLRSHSDQAPAVGALSLGGLHVDEYIRSIGGVRQQRLRYTGRNPG